MLNLPQTTQPQQALIIKNYTVDCNWDPMTLTNNTLYALAFEFL